MSAFLPDPAFGPGPEPDHPKLRQRRPSPDEQRARWAVRAAQWRARALAEAAFGSVTGMGLSGIRGEGAFRGLLRLDVPFSDLAQHREREARFLHAVDRDPVLSDVPLLYVIGPDPDASVPARARRSADAAPAVESGRPKTTRIGGDGG